MQTISFQNFQKGLCSSIMLLCSVWAFAQQTSYSSTFNYKDICKKTFIPVAGFNDTQTHYFTILKHSFEVQKIKSAASDTTFVWNGLKGKKTIYSKDSLSLFFLRPNDTIMRPVFYLRMAAVHRLRRVGTR